MAMLPSLVWVAIKIVRPFLITATYVGTQTSGIEEQRRRAEHGVPPVPLLARPLLAISAGSRVWWGWRFGGASDRVRKGPLANSARRPTYSS